MNKKLLLIVLSFCLVSCSVDNDELYPEGMPISENLTFEASADCAYLDAGPDNSMTILESEAVAIESWDEVRKMYQRLLARGVSKYGTFNPSIDEIIVQFNKESIGDFPTTYTITDGECSDSVELTVSVRGTLDAPTCEPVNAGADGSNTLTEKATRTRGSTVGSVEMIFLRMLDPDVELRGVPRSFSPTMDQLIADFNQSPIGIFETTLTLGEGECQDSVVLTLTVIGDAQNSPICKSVNAGADGSNTLTEKGARTRGTTVGSVEMIFLRMLDPDVKLSGVPRSFSPSIEQLIADFNQSPIGVFQTTLTLGEGDCQDSVELTLTVVP